MNDPVDRISVADTHAIARRRARANWMVFAALAAFAVAVFVLSFTHLSKESGAQKTPVASGSQSTP